MLQGKQLQLLLENVKDRIQGAPIHANGLIPVKEPGIESIILRDLQRTIVRAEHKIKLSITPKRKTDLPGTPREVYEEKIKYNLMGCFSSNAILFYPAWADLTEEQLTAYGNDSSLYTNGSLPWDYMTNAQVDYFSRRVIYVPNKSGDAEVLDGRARSYIKLYERNLIKVHSVKMQLRNPSNINTSFFSRTYTRDEIIPYKKEGAIMLMPALTRSAAMASGGAGVSATGYGMAMPRLPQILHVDYSYGLTEIPLDLQEAISLLTAAKVFQTVNIMYTNGLTGFNVQGFSAQFGKGMYADIIAMYQEEAENILSQYSLVTMVGW